MPMSPMQSSGFESYKTLIINQLERVVGSFKEPRTVWNSERKQLGVRMHVLAERLA
jgi:hypothetical protein